MSIVDGKEIATRLYEDIRSRISLFGRSPRLTIITCAPNFETQKYLALKEQKAKQIGIQTETISLNIGQTTNDFIHTIDEHISESDGILVQLPLPEHIDVERVIAHIPMTHDVDS